MLGGLIAEDVEKQKDKVPILGDIPFLGRFFRRDTDTLDRTELLITITPYVVRGRDDAVSVTDDFTARVEGMKQMRNAMRARRTRQPIEPEQPLDAPPPRR